MPVRFCCQVKSGSLPLLLLPLLGFCFSCRSSPPHGAPLFEDVAKQSGIDFWQYSGAKGEFLLPEMVGSGAALIDYDNDGDMDVFLVQGYPTDPQGKAIVPVPSGWKPGNRLFRNNLNPSGKLTFTDVTESAGLGHAGQGMGVAAGDYDNDGYTDLYVTNYDHNILYHNNGNGTFTDVTATAGVASVRLVYQCRVYRLRSGRPARSGGGSLRAVLSPSLLFAAGFQRLLRSAAVRRIRHAAISQSRERTLQRRDGGGGPEREKGARTRHPDGRFRHGRVSGFHGCQRRRGQPPLDQSAA